MSAGDFLDTKYELGAISGQIWKIRVQEEAIDLVFDNAPNPDIINEAPSGAITAGISVKVNKGNREFGVRPRYFVLEWLTGKPADYTGDTVRVPILTEATYNGIPVGATVVNVDTTKSFRVKAKVPEQFR